MKVNARLILKELNLLKKRSRVKIAKGIPDNVAENPTFIESVLMTRHGFMNITSKMYKPKPKKQNSLNSSSQPRQVYRKICIKIC